MTSKQLGFLERGFPRCCLLNTSYIAANVKMTVDDKTGTENTSTAYCNILTQHLLWKAKEKHNTFHSRQLINGTCIETGLPNTMQACRLHFYITGKFTQVISHKAACYRRRWDEVQWFSNLSKLEWVACSGTPQPVYTAAKRTILQVHGIKPRRPVWAMFKNLRQNTWNPDVDRRMILKSNFEK